MYARRLAGVCIWSAIGLRYNPRLPATRQLGPLSMLGLWAVLTLTGALYSAWQGYGGRAFAATLTAFAFFFLVMLLFAARGVEDRLASRFGAGSGYLLGAAVFLVYLIYSLGTNTFAFTRSVAVAALVFIPLALAASAEHQSPGVWQDFLTLVGIWVAVKPLPNPWGWSFSHWLWPFPGGRLAYVFTVLLCVNVALATFLLLRRVTCIGYSIGWGYHWSFFILASFIVFACIAIPLGLGMHFIEFQGPWGLSWVIWWSTLKSLPVLSIGILFFTAVCCKICFPERARAISWVGVQPPFSSSYRTSRTITFPTGAT